MFHVEHYSLNVSRVTLFHVDPPDAKASNKCFTWNECNVVNNI